MKPLCAIFTAAQPLAVLTITVLLWGGASAVGEDCYCDGWQSTNTASPHMWWMTPTPGKSYRGAKNTTRGGLRCVPWKDAFARCAADTSAFTGPPNYARMLVNVAEDPIGVAGGSPSQWNQAEGEDGIPDNACGTPRVFSGPSVFSGLGGGGGGRFPMDSGFKTISSPSDVYLTGRFSPDDQWEWAAVNAGGPWCFVEEADFNAAGETEISTVPDGPGGHGSTEDELRSRKIAPPCGNLRRLPCDVPQCVAPPVCISSTKPGPMLVANGGFEDWRTPSLRWRQASPFYDKFTSARPLDVMHWEFVPWSLKMGQWGAGAPTTLPFARFAAAWPGWKVGAAVTRQQRDGDVAEGDTSYARIRLRGEPFVLRTQIGAVASLIAGAKYRLQAQVRCEAGTADAPNNVVVGLGMAVLQGMPVPGKPMRVIEGIWNFWGVEGPLIEPLNVVTNAGGTVPGRADGTALAFLNCSRAANQMPAVTATDVTGEGWVTLQLQFTPAETSRDTQVQISFGDSAKGATGVDANDADAADRLGRSEVFGVVHVDNVELHRMDEDTSPAAATGCTSDMWRCKKDPFNMAYRLREEGGVPVTLEQMSQLSAFRMDAQQCRPPDPDAFVRWGDPLCPFMSKFPMPHSGSREVSARLATLSDAEVLRVLGWNKAGWRGGGGTGGDGSTAAAIIREDFPTVVDGELIRALGGPVYGGRRVVDDHGLGVHAQPIRNHAWYSRAATSDGAYLMDGSTTNCSTNRARNIGQTCYLEVGRLTSNYSSKLNLESFPGCSKASHSFSTKKYLRR